jgi:hypothetical protein
MVIHTSNSIIKFSVDKTVVVTNNDETAYREEERDLAEWGQENNLSLNIYKTKKLIVDFRKQHAPIHIDGTAIEVESFKFLGVHITHNLKWSTHTQTVL